MKLSNSYYIASNGPAGASTFAPSGDSEKVVFDIVITDPCKTATVNDVTYSPSTISVVDGSSATTTYIAPTNSVMDTHSTPSLFCDSTSYGIFTDNDGTDTAPSNGWAAISGPVSSTYTVTIDTSLDLNLIANEASVTYTLYVKSTLDSYTSQVKYTALTVTITEVGCDCSYLRWTNPSADMPTLDVASLSTLTVPVPTRDDSATAEQAAYQKCDF
jgi:hypothetical protein